VPVTFDGDNLLVDLPSGVTNLDAQEDFYETWKTYLLTRKADGSSNLVYPQVFRPIAGDDIVTGILQYAGMFFFRNDLGWRLRLPDEDITVTLTGNFALQDPSIPFFTPRAGRTGAILGLAGFVTASSQMLELNRVMKNKMTTNPLTGILTIRNDDDTADLLTAPIYEDVAGTQPYRGQGIERRDKLS